MPPKTYPGSCHCAAIKYTITLSDALTPDGAGTITKCSCSICRANGYLLVYPKREDVVWLNDSESKLKDYYFNTKTKAHRFCPECGSSVLIDFREAEPERLRGFVAVNARMLEGVDLEKAEYDHGKKLGV